MKIDDIMNVLSSGGIALLSVVIVIITVLTYVRRGTLKLGGFSIDLGTTVEREAEQIRRRIAEEVPEADPAERQYVLLKEYHTQGLAQSKISFWFSLVFASVGFVVIIISILTWDRNAQSLEQQQALVSLIAGTIIEAVSALFFAQSNRARQLMTEFFDRLRTDRKLDESLRLVDGVPDKTLQSRLQVLMALNFAQVNSSDGILKMVMDLEDRDLVRTQASDQDSDDTNPNKPSSER